ncbi:hypothetical protein BASA83_006376 [Batrachochytrium salamandrivorans]|nr:hypothetical protein BASA83_006376 [Batrachochytrium salamandrivorans]
MTSIYKKHKTLTYFRILVVILFVSSIALQIIALVVSSFMISIGRVSVQFLVISGMAYIFRQQTPMVARLNLGPDGRYIVTVDENFGIPRPSFPAVQPEPIATQNTVHNPALQMTQTNPTDLTNHAYGDTLAPAVLLQEHNESEPNLYSTLNLEASEIIFIFVDFFMIYATCVS